MSQLHVEESSPVPLFPVALCTSHNIFLPLLTVLVPDAVSIQQAE